MVCLEWWAYEFCIFMAGWLPNPTLSVASMGVMLQVSGFCYMLPMVRAARLLLRSCCIWCGAMAGDTCDGAGLIIAVAAHQPASQPASQPTRPPPPCPPCLQGLSCAVSVRVSNALGANLPHAARRSAYTATAITACTQASLVTAMLLGRYHWAAAFTNLPEVCACICVGQGWAGQGRTEQSGLQPPVSGNEPWQRTTAVNIPCAGLRLEYR
jgi:hypothetical protein